MSRKTVGEVMTRVPEGGSTDAREAHGRYAALVDKKFSSGLTEAEQVELLRLESYMNELDAEVYEPIKNKLQAALGPTTTKA